jgi:hypothetical protein
VSLYPGLAGVVSSVLASFGGPVTFTRATGAYNPATDSRAAGTTTVTLSGLQDVPSERYALDAAVRDADELVFVAPSSAFTPAVGDTVTGWRGRNWRVEAVQTIAPDGATTLLVACGLRRG